MFELLLQTFRAKKKPCKSLLISTLDKVIYYIGAFLQGSTKPHLTSQTRVETSWKKLTHFFNISVLDLPRYLWVIHTEANLKRKRVVDEEQFQKLDSLGR
jgi:hypothetical protein